MRLDGGWVGEALLQYDLHDVVREVALFEAQIGTRHGVSSYYYVVYVPEFVDILLAAVLHVVVRNVKVLSERFQFHSVPHRYGTGLFLVLLRFLFVLF